MAGGDELPGRARERFRIDTMMLVEALVFIGKEQFQEARIDVMHRRRQPPAPFGGGIGAQQLPVPVEHELRIFQMAAEPRRPERIDPGRPANKDREAQDDGSREGKLEATPALRLALPLLSFAVPRGCDAVRTDDIGEAAHFPAVISIVPVAVRPKRSGRYISST